TGYTAESAEAAEIFKASELLARLLAQDVRRTDTGRPEIVQGVAPERIISVHDTEMRHGRKSSSVRFDGFKGAIAVDTQSQMITAIDVLPANVADGQSSTPLIDESATTTDATITTVLGDTAYGTTELRLQAKDHFRLITPMPHAGHTGRFTKDDFTIDLENSTVTCPAGKTAPRSYPRKTTTRSGHVFQNREFYFAEADCSSCSLRTQCIAPNVARRTILVHEQERLLQNARRFQHTDEFHELYRSRVVVEHRFARLVRLGLRQARYFGKRKALFQLAMTAAVANLTLLAAAIPGNNPFPFVAVALTAVFLVTVSQNGHRGTLTLQFASLSTSRTPKNGGSQLSF
ncbi:MAG TPA: transposase, partial [Bacteroidota bacterium]|nr:transposase [Bacteroidota bacterium]